MTPFETRSQVKSVTVIEETEASVLPAMLTVTVAPLASCPVYVPLIAASADAAANDFDQQLALAGPRIGQLDNLELSVRAGDGLHVSESTPGR